MSCKRTEISSIAFVKLQLHLAKYPHCAVNGLLLACKQRYAEEHILEIVDVVPLFHQCLQLTPMLEVALIDVDAHCNANQLIIAGYYEAPEQLSAKPEPSLFSMKVADKLKSNFSDSRLVIINNKKIPTLSSLCFYASKGLNEKWREVEDKVHLEDGAIEEIEYQLKKKVYRDLVDFDNHLSDISQHWLNKSINKVVCMK